MLEIKQFKVFLTAEKSSSTHTVDGYIRDITQFFKFIQKNPLEVSHYDISKYLTNLKSKGLKTGTSNRKLSSIKSFFRYCVSRLGYTNNPAAVIQQGKHEKRLPKPIDLENIDKMISLANNLRDRTLLETLFGTGVRREELVSLKVSDINFNRKFIKVFGKGGKERIIPIYPKLASLMFNLAKSHGSIWVFPSPRQGKHLSVRRCNDIVEIYKNKAGLQNLDITPHKFRHSFATSLYENGADIKAIQEMMGHSSIDTTNNYTKVCISRNTNEYLRCHPRAK